MLRVGALMCLLLFDVRCSLLVVRCSLFVVRCVSLVVLCVLFCVRYFGV